jgi:hypothetical protein
MKYSFEILSALHKALADAVSSSSIKLKGEVLIGQDTQPSKGREVIALNMLDNQADYLQDGILNVNVYLDDVKGERANLKRFNTIMAVIFPVIDDNVVYLQNVTLHLTIDNDGGVKPSQQKGRSYYNVRVNFVTL